MKDEKSDTMKWKEYLDLLHPSSLILHPFLFLVFALLAFPVRAQDSAAWYKYISVNGLVSGSTTYNVNHPPTLKNRLRIFDVDANSILLDIVSLTARHDPAIGEAGFRVDLNAGPYIPGIMQSVGWPAT